MWRSLTVGGCFRCGRRTVWRIVLLSVSVAVIAGSAAVGLTLNSVNNVPVPQLIRSRYAAFSGGNWLPRLFEQTETGNHADTDNTDGNADASPMHTDVRSADDKVGVRLPAPSALIFGEDIGENNSTRNILAYLQSIQKPNLPSVPRDIDGKIAKRILVLGDPLWATQYGALYRDAAAAVRTDPAVGITLVSTSTVREAAAGAIEATNGVTIGILAKCVCVNSLSEKCIPYNDYASLPSHVRVSAICGLSPSVRIGKDVFCEAMTSALEGFDPPRASALTERQGGGVEAVKGFAAANDLADQRAFTFPCFVLPREIERLRVASSTNAGNWPFIPGQKWLIKATDRHSGQGMYSVDSVDELVQQFDSSPMPESASQKPRVAMPLMHPPFLFNGRKFDLRVYTLVTSMTPLRVYIHEEGIVRLSGEQYKTNATSAELTGAQLLPYSHAKGATSEPPTLETFATLRAHFAALGHDVNALFERIRSAIARVFLSFEALLLNPVNGGTTPDNSRGYALFGVDIIIDTDLQPRVMEVNANANMLHTSGSSVIANAKLPMARDVLRMIYGDGGDCAAALHRRLSALPGVTMVNGTDNDCGNNRLCVTEADLAILLESSCERMRCNPHSTAEPCLFRAAYPTADGAKYSSFVAHLARRRANGVRPVNSANSVPTHGLHARSSWRLFEIETELRKLEESERR